MQILKGGGTGVHKKASTPLPQFLLAPTSSHLEFPQKYEAKSFSDRVSPSLLYTALLRNSSLPRFFDRTFAQP